MARGRYLLHLLVHGAAHCPRLLLAASDAPCRPGQVFASTCRGHGPGQSGAPCNFSGVFGPDAACKTLNDLVGMRSGQVVVDVGLNVPDLWTFMPAARRRAAHVVAFEPIPRVCEASRRAARSAARGRFRVDVRCKAVSDLPRRGTLRVDADTPRSTMSPAVAAGLGLNTSPAAVEVATLDGELLPGLAGGVDVLKSDTQGHELAVLRGARRLLGGGRARFLLVELDPWLLRHSRASAGELLAELHGLGFSCLVAPERFTGRTRAGVKHWSDLICAPHGRVAALLGSCLVCSDFVESEWYTA